MPMRRRDVLRLAGGAAALPAISTLARAEVYPAHPIKLLVGFPPGGQVDIVARLSAQWLSQQLGQTIVVENRPGAGGSLGAEAVVGAPPDGYTLFFAASSNTVNASLMKNLSYDFVRDVTPVAPINRINLVFDANPSFTVNGVADLIAQAKASPGKIVIASPSLGTPPYMAVELLKMMAGIDVVHVPYAGEGQLVTDLLGGQVKVGSDGISAVIGDIKAGKLRALALTTATRIDELPGVPTVAETLPGFEASGFSGLVAPKNTPPVIVEKLAGAVKAIQADAKFKERLAQLGVSALSMSPQEFGKFIAAETEKWAKVVKFAGLKPQ
ncbi:MAG TPA: tripartite tricarboxylate transporter substrate binding protein [Xanthobacteraceae bacterium]|nr:tripartite tricarboxylate transporter substrate binding protein [Xanthobacteraceae bacterium]